MANTKVTKAVLADDAVGLAQLDITNDPSDGQALTYVASSNDLQWANNTVAGISSSADATAITLDSSERVGIGDATSPTKQLEIRNNNATAGTGGAELRLTRGDSNVAAEDPIGTIEFYNTDADGAHVSSFIKGIAQETYGRQGALTIGTASTNATDAIELARFAPTQLTIGRTSGSITAEEQGLVLNKSGYIYCARDGSSSATVLAFARKTDTTAVNVGSITTSGTATAYNTSSDYRLKENVVTDWDATTRLKQLRPSRFNFIAEPDRTVDGFLAHEVSDIVPEAITGEKDATETYTDDEGNEQTRPIYQAIDQAKLVPLLVKTIQELEARITTLENS